MFPTFCLAVGNTSDHLSIVNNIIHRQPKNIVLISAYVPHSTTNKKSAVNANGKAQQLCMFESPVKLNLSQLSEGAR